MNIIAKYGLAAGAFLAMIAQVAPVTARDYGQFANPPEIKEWFGRVMQPDQPLSCCGEADAYWADSFEVDTAGNYVAIITDEREAMGRVPIPVGTKIVVPPNKLDTRNQGNPTGHGVIFLRAVNIGAGRQDYLVYCMFMPGGV